MKFKLFITFGSLIIITNFFSYYIGFNNGRETKNIQFNDLDGNDLFLKIDYPLIDIYFNSESEWLVIDRSKIFTDHEVFNIIQNSQELEFYKEWIKLLTFPVGRGTTPNGYLYIYKDKYLIRAIPYFEIYFENENIKKTFQQSSKNEIENILKNKLQPMI